MEAEVMQLTNIVANMLEREKLLVEAIQKLTDLTAIILKRLDTIEMWPVLPN